MQKFNIAIKNTRSISIILSVIVSILFVVGVVQAATTIGSNISTGGTVSVTGLTTLGQASSTRISVFDTAYFGGTATSTFSSAGVLTLAGNLVLTTASSTGLATFDSVKISTTGTSITNHISATASLDFPIVAANSCQTLTITATGAADGDTVALGLPNALASASSTLAWSGWISAANTVSVRVCQVAVQATSDPAAATVRADVWKH